MRSNERVPRLLGRPRTLRAPYADEGHRSMRGFHVAQPLARDDTRATRTIEDDFCRVVGKIAYGPRDNLRAGLRRYIA